MRDFIEFDKYSLCFYHLICLFSPNITNFGEEITVFRRITTKKFKFYHHLLVNFGCKNIN